MNKFLITIILMLFAAPAYSADPETPETPKKWVLICNMGRNGSLPIFFSGIAIAPNGAISGTMSTEAHTFPKIVYVNPGAPCLLMQTNEEFTTNNPE